MEKNNMPKYSKASLKVLETLHVDLKTLLLEVINHVDIKLTCGYRGKIAQNKAYDTGYSKLKYPNSKHNKKPAEAVDIELYPKSDAVQDICYIIGIIKGIALIMEIDIRCGADWNNNDRLSDERFVDLLHLELSFS